MQIFSFLGTRAFEGLIGAYMGWQIRLGNGEEVTPLTLGETIREAHPKSA